MSHVDKKIIGFDMDGVVINNNPLKLEIAQKLGYKLQITQTASEIIRKILVPEDLKSLQTALYHNLGVSINAGLMPGITNLLSQIKERGSPFYLISRRAAPEIAIEYLKVKGLWPKYFNESNAFFAIIFFSIGSITKKAFDSLKYFGHSPFTFKYSIAISGAALLDIK